MTPFPAATPPVKSLGKRFLQFPLTRIVLATFGVALSGGLTLSFASSIVDEAARSMWP